MHTLCYSDAHFPVCSDAEPPAKKPKTTSVVVEQAGQGDKLLIDQVTDTESSFDEVSICTLVGPRGAVVLQ